MGRPQYNFYARTGTQSTVGMSVGTWRSGYSLKQWHPSGQSKPEFQQRKHDFKQTAVLVTSLKVKCIGSSLHSGSHCFRTLRSPVRSVPSYITLMFCRMVE